MGLRQRRWAKTARLNLMLKLGMICNKYGEEKDLTFDCIIPQGNKHHNGMDSSMRMSFYRKQEREGNLQVLCNKCNARKRNEEENNPF